MLLIMGHNGDGLDGMDNLGDDGGDDDFIFLLIGPALMILIVVGLLLGLRLSWNQEP